MASRASLNKVLLIGNLTRDPELRYTPSGAAVCTFGVATNRFYVASDGTKKEEAEFIKIVSWNKLAELCSQLLSKGRKVYVEGRLQTRSWETPDGQNRQTTEVVIDDMRILDSRRDFEGAPAADEDYAAPDAAAIQPPVEPEADTAGEKQPKKKASAKEDVRQPDTKKTKDKSEEQKSENDVKLDDLPF